MAELIDLAGQQQLAIRYGGSCLAVPLTEGVVRDPSADLVSVRVRDARHMIRIGRAAGVREEWVQPNPVRVGQNAGQVVEPSNLLRFLNSAQSAGDQCLPSNGRAITSSENGWFTRRFRLQPMSSTTDEGK